MSIKRLVSLLVTVLLVGGLTVMISGSAEAVPRLVTINGVKSKGKLFIRGKVGSDYAAKRVKVERQAFPGGKWRKFKTAGVNSKGIYRVRVNRVPGSRSTCYRVRVKAWNGLEKSRSKVTCVVRA